MESANADLSYQEKSIWGSLIATVLIYGRYFLSGGQNSLIATIVLLVIVQIVYQIALAVMSGHAPKDERDRTIEAKGYRSAYFLLVTGAILCMNILSAPKVTSLMMALVAAEAGKSITQLVCYRRGV